MAQWNPATDFLRGVDGMSRIQHRDRQAELQDRRMTLAEAQAERQGEAHDLSMETNRFKLNELERARERENIQEALRGVTARHRGPDGRITDPSAAYRDMLADENLGPFFREAMRAELGTDSEVTDFVPSPNQPGMVVPVGRDRDGRASPFFEGDDEDADAFALPDDPAILDDLLARFDPEGYAGLLDARAQHRQRQGQAGLLESMIGEQEQPVDTLNRRIDAEMERIDRDRPAVVDDIERQRGEVMRDAGLMGALSTPRGVEVRSEETPRETRSSSRDASFSHRVGETAATLNNLPRQAVSRAIETAGDLTSPLRSMGSDVIRGATGQEPRSRAEGVRMDELEDAREHLRVMEETGGGRHFDPDVIEEQRATVRDLERELGVEPTRPQIQDSAPAQEVEVSRPIPGREADGPNLRERRQQLEGMDEFRQELERAREQGSQRQATAQRQHATRRRLAKDLTQAVSDGVVDLDGAMSIWESMQPQRPEVDSWQTIQGPDGNEVRVPMGSDGQPIHEGFATHGGGDDRETRQTRQNRINDAVEAVGGTGNTAAGIMMLDHEGRIPGIDGNEQVLASQLTDLASSAVRERWNIFAPWTYDAIPRNIKKRFTVGRRDSVDDFSAAEWATMANAARMGYQDDLPSFQSDFMQPIGRLAEDGHISQPDAVMTGLAETYVEMTQGRNPVSHDRALALLRQQLSNPEAMAELEQEYGGRR